MLVCWLCVCVRTCCWQEVQLLTEGLVRARVQASVLTDNFPLRGGVHSGDTLRPRALCLDVSPLLYLTALLYSLCNLIKSDPFTFIPLFACFPPSRHISIRLFVHFCTFFLFCLWKSLFWNTCSYIIKTCTSLNKYFWKLWKVLNATSVKLFIFSSTLISGWLWISRQFS